MWRNVERDEERKGVVIRPQIYVTHLVRLSTGSPQSLINLHNQTLIRRLSIGPDLAPRASFRLPQCHRRCVS